MASPADEIPEPTYPTYQATNRSDEESTVVANGSSANEHGKANTTRNNSHLTLHTTALGQDAQNHIKSPSQTREQANRLNDDLKLLQVERLVSRTIEEAETRGELQQSRSRSAAGRERSRREEVLDEFDVATNPLHERAQIYKPPENPSTAFSKFFKKVHGSNVLIRYFTYIMPIFFIILIPLLIGALLPTARRNRANVGGVSLLWFCVWLEIVWLTLWAGRLLAKALPWPVGIIASLFTNSSKKWRDMAKQLELAATLFFWWLGIEVSFLPTMTHHHVDGARGTKSWEATMNKVLVSFFVAAILNLAEKIIIQLIAISFHMRTYEDRIELNKFQIGSLTKLYAYSKNKLQVQDSDFEDNGPSQPGSGARTPGQVLEKAQKGTKEALTKFGDVAGKIAGDFTGKKITASNHPSQVVITLLGSTTGSQVLARRLYRTFNREETETVHQEDLENAFDANDECEAAFTMFDKDMNGDISMEELESVIVEIGRERKAILASLKDLDSVVSKLDDCFTFIVAVITILVFISLISTAAAGVLTSAGSAVLALSWLFSATAQEFLQSVIFVFVKHPFDVGDRVTVYGNTGTNMKGDDYFVKQISLLYTEFKKMEGHVVQAPNSYLNTLFILNNRRSGGLAEAVPITFKFGTTLEQIDGLRQKLLEFVKAEKREYQGNILTELRDIVEAHSITLNIVFFFKSNWQNELLRLQRRNKFICALMVSMQELGIEGPRMRYPGQKESFPLYMQNLPYDPNTAGQGGHPDNPNGIGKTQRVQEDMFVPNEADAEPMADFDAPMQRMPSISRERSHSTFRRRGESIAAMGKRLDFSLGMSEISSGDPAGDVFADREPKRAIPISVNSPSRHSSSRDRAYHEGGRNFSHDRPSMDIAHSTSRAPPAPGFLHRSATDNMQRTGSMHRNRFFPSFPRRSHDTERMETGMAGIPEGDGTTSPRGGFPASRRLDPRSGLVSPAAVRANTNESTVGQEVSFAGQSLFHSPGTGVSRTRAATLMNPHSTGVQDFEMHKMR